MIIIIIYMLITLLFMFYLINVEETNNCKKIIWIDKNDDLLMSWIYLYIVLFFTTWFILPSIVYYKCMKFVYRGK